MLQDIKLCYQVGILRIQKLIYHFQRYYFHCQILLFYIDNHQNYKFLCTECYGKLEHKRLRKIPSVLDDTFDNKKFLELKKQYEDFETQRVKDEKQARILLIKEHRPSLYKSQHGDTNTSKTKKNNK